MIVFLILSLTFAQESVYIGQIKYSLQPGQTFEHQFFKIENVHSMDLYFPDPPHRLVEDKDFNCYWSFQQIGIKEIANWPAQNIEDQTSNGDILCLGEQICYLTHFEKLYAISGKQIMKTRRINQLVKFSTILAEWDLPPSLANSKIIDFSQRGFIGLFQRNSKHFELRDIARTLAPKKQQSDDFLSHLFLNTKSYAVNHHTLTLYACTNQIQVINFFDITNIQELEPIGENGCEEIKIYNDTLYIRTDKEIIIYDIYDPIWTQKIITIESEALNFDINQTHLIIIEKDNSMKLYRQINFEFELVISSNLVMVSKPIEKMVLQERGAIIIQDNNVYLIDLVRTPFLTTHQSNRHQMNLTMSEHYLNSTRDEVHIVKDKILQVSSGVIRMYSPSTESYNLVCQAPFLKNYNTQSLRYFGVIRSENQCSEILKQGKEERIKEILVIERENQKENIKCLYTFNLILSVEAVRLKIKKQLIAVGFLVCIVLVWIIANKVRQQLKEKGINETLKKFEELNSEQVQNEKIRITHHIDGSDEEDKLDDQKQNMEEDLL